MPSSSKLAHLSLDAQRQRLPIYKHRQKLLWCVENYQVVIVVGQTGSGKSTRKLKGSARLSVRNTAVPSRGGMDSREPHSGMYSTETSGSYECSYSSSGGGWQCAG